MIFPFGFCEWRLLQAYRFALSHKHGMHHFIKANDLASCWCHWSCISLFWCTKARPGCIRVAVFNGRGYLPKIKVTWYQSKCLNEINCELTIFKMHSEFFLKGNESMHSSSAHRKGTERYSRWSSQPLPQCQCSSGPGREQPLHTWSCQFCMQILGSSFFLLQVWIFAC